MNIPVNLRHKPVITVENYENVDGRSAYKSDAKGLSLGLAQWNDRGKVDIAAKVWRHTGGKWSRQSEELPLHRALDLAILICRTHLYFQDAYRYPKLYNPEKPQIDRVGLQGDAMTVSVCTENPMLEEDIQLFAQTLGENGELIGERLTVLAELLEKAGYCRTGSQDDDDIRTKQITLPF